VSSRLDLRVVVVGGSLGGLTAGLLLRDLGAEVDVYERSRNFLEGLGAGIVLHPASVRYVAERSDRQVAELSSRATRLRYLNRDGTVAQEAPCRYRFTSYRTLYRILLDRFDGRCYHLGRPVTGFEADDDGVTVTVADREVTRCDLLVCADGIHSTARQVLLPEVLPDFAGYVGWRGTVSEAGCPELLTTLRDAITYFVMPHSHILAYPIPGAADSSEGGRTLTNWVWYRNVPAGPELDDLLTDRKGNARSVSLAPGTVKGRHVARLREAATELLPPALATMVRHTADPFVQAVFDIDVPRMAFGRVCLMGDAAFALRPHAAAGTAKAAADAWALADALVAADGDVVPALEQWERGQLPLGRRVLERTREAGERSQVRNAWPVGAPLPFGLHATGDSELA
jgi:2,6-dihydroxypyridine 3-monooxygenase